MAGRNGSIGSVTGMGDDNEDTGRRDDPPQPETASHRGPRREECPMAEDAPFHAPTTLPRRSETDPHSYFEEVAEDDGFSRNQFWIGWVCAVVTVALVGVVWFLL
jgi:hypothetical protein